MRRDIFPFNTERELDAPHLELLGRSSLVLDPGSGGGKYGLGGRVSLML